MSADLDALIVELEAAAADLREGRVQGPQAAATVERCVDLATAIAADLAQQARDAEREAAGIERPDQERLL